MKCVNCEKETTNPKYCSRSCAAIQNNKKFPKREVESFCKRCSNSCTKTRSYCKACWKEVVAEKSVANWETCTLGELKGIGNANAGGRYPYIRNLARKNYLKSDLPKACVVCGYDKHFDVAHIKDIQSFPEEALVSEVNSLSNLKALCKNHHWEFDHGMLNIPELGLIK